MAIWQCFECAEVEHWGMILGWYFDVIFECYDYERNKFFPSGTWCDCAAVVVRRLKYTVNKGLSLRDLGGAGGLCIRRLEIVFLFR